jgi:hypothetical protein
MLGKRPCIDHIMDGENGQAAELGVACGLFAALANEKTKSGVVTTIPRDDDRDGRAVQLWLHNSSRKQPEGRA